MADQQGDKTEGEDIQAPVWCYECNKQFTFKLKAGASQKKLPPREIDRLVSNALHASKWEMMTVVNEDGEDTGQQAWFCEDCAEEVAKEFDKLKKKKPWWQVHR